MPHARLRTRRLLAVILAVMCAAVVYVLATSGADRIARDQAESDAAPPVVLPQTVYDPPASVPTTSARGPAGRVALVFPVREVRQGLAGRLTRRWVAVASDGDYRALSAPHLPRARPGAIRVADDGSLLAWGAPGGIVVYDPIVDVARSIDLSLEGTPGVGPFSPDAGLLVVHDGRLHVVRHSTGEVVATGPGMGRRAATGAAWTPDGNTVAFTSSGVLGRFDWRGGTTTRTPAPVPAGASLSWDASGRRLAVEVRRATGNRVRVLSVRSSDRVADEGALQRDLHSMQRMLGFGNGSVIVVGRGLQTGTISTVYGLPLDGQPATDLASLPDTEGVVDTLAVAADALSAEPRAFEEPSWPINDLAKLVATIAATLFLLGLYLTRNPDGRSRRRRG